MNSLQLTNKKITGEYMEAKIVYMKEKTVSGQRMAVIEALTAVIKAQAALIEEHAAVSKAQAAVIRKLREKNEGLVSAAQWAGKSLACERQTFTRMNTAAMESHASEIQRLVESHASEIQRRRLAEECPAPLQLQVTELENMISDVFFTLTDEEGTPTHGFKEGVWDAETRQTVVYVEEGVFGDLAFTLPGLGHPVDRRACTLEFKGGLRKDTFKEVGFKVVCERSGAKFVPDTVFCVDKNEEKCTFRLSKREKVIATIVLIKKK